MLSIAPIASAQYYLSLSSEDYYLQGGEPPGRWFGRGAGALGLAGEVARDDLAALLDGVAPDGRRLVQFQRYSGSRARQKGLDLTFSAPKSLSVLWATADTPTRHAIQQAHHAAVQAALTYLEDEAALCRRGKGGTVRERAGLVVATFEHGCSRAQDPDLHTHALVVNVGLRQDSSFGALFNKPLFTHKMAAGALYRAELGHQLKERLGLALTPKRTWFEVLGVPETLKAAFSTRRAQIEAALAERGWVGAKAAELLAKSTRQVKGHVAREQLFSLWQRTAREHGFGIEEATALVRTPERHEPAKPKLGQAVQGALGQLMKGQATFLAHDLVRRSAERLQAKGVSAELVRSEVKEFLKHSGTLIHLQDAAGNARFTTQAMYALEEKLLDTANRLERNTSHALSTYALDASLAGRPPIRPEQRGVLEHIITSPGAIKCVSGMAGTGKTFLLAAAREVWEKQGYRVVGTALSARAARQLEKEAKIQSVTLARLESLLTPPTLGRQLRHHVRQLVRAARKRPTWRLPAPKLGPDSVVVLDEAGMVGTRQLAWLLGEVQKAGAKVVLVGDARQLQPIESGGPFAALTRRLGAAELRDITRQRESWMRRAVHQFAEGDARGALAQYAAHERLHVEKDRQLACQALLNAWSKGRTRELSETLILAGNNEEVTTLNQGAQAARLAGGELDPARSVRGQKATYHVGERVVFTKNNRLLGVTNGDFGTVEAVRKGTVLAPASLVVRLDRQDECGGQIRTLVGLDQERFFQLGYATTTHKAQGATVERAFVLGGGWMTDRELSYVQMSRSRGETHIYVSEGDAGEDLTELANAMRRSRAKELAHTYNVAPSHELK